MINKKGFELTWEVIIVGAILLITLIVILLFATGGFKKIFGNVNENIDNLGDPDKDGVSNIFDQCPCIPFTGQEQEGLRGCPTPMTKEGAQADKDKFKQNNKC